MRSVRFWKTEAKLMSISERMFYRDAIETLLNWQVLRDEYGDLELIKRILDSEIQVQAVEPKLNSIYKHTSVQKNHPAI